MWCVVAAISPQNPHVATAAHTTHSVSIQNSDVLNGTPGVQTKGCPLFMLPTLVSDGMIESDIGPGQVASMAQAVTEHQGDSSLSVRSLEL